MIKKMHLYDLVRDSVINQGAPIKGYKTQVDYKRYMPGSENYADAVADAVAIIEELPTLAQQLEYIKQSEWLQWPVYMLSIKDTYGELV